MQEVIARLESFWWDRVPSRVARVSVSLGLVLRDGSYMKVWPAVAAVAPPAALVLGFLAGWRHPLATDVYMTSLILLVLGVVIGTLSAAVGAWLVLGFTIGDLFLGVRDPAFLGVFTNSGKTWAALILCDLVLAMLIVLVPLTARALANEVAARWLRGQGLLPEISVGVLVQALLTFAWAEAALVLTRPYYLWHGTAPNPAVIATFHTALWALPLVALGAASLRAWLEVQYAAALPPPAPLPARERRVQLPMPLSIVLRVGLAVFLLAGLMDSYVDAIIVAVIMAALLVLRGPALRRFGARAVIVTRVPVLPRLAAGALISAVIAIILVAAFGSTSVVRPIVISTLVSLIVFTVLLPDRLLTEHEGAAEHAPAAAQPPTPLPPSPSHAAATGAVGGP